MLKDRIDSLSIADPGRILFIFSDKTTVQAVFEEPHLRRLHIVYTDKDLIVTGITRVEVPEEFFDREDIKFFRPISNSSNGEIINTYIGAYKIDGVYKRFCIENHILTAKGELDFNQQGTIQELLGSEYEVVAHITKRNRIFVVGYDLYEGNRDPFYGCYNTEERKFEQVYYLFNDRGDLLLNTVNIDVDSGFVYVGGETITGGVVNPYFEAFLLRKQ